MTASPETLLTVGVMVERSVVSARITWLGLPVDVCRGARVTGAVVPEPAPSLACC
jgi:hypothetical protein